MPSLVVSDASPDLMDSKKTKKKFKTIADNSMDLDAAENGDAIDELKSEKKKKKKEKKLDSNEELASSEKKRKKKRKASDTDEEGSGSGSDGREDIKELAEGSALRKKAKLMEKEEEVVESPNSVSKFRISEPLREKLKSKGIEALFPIQAMTFNLVLDGSDLVGRARTGQVGKITPFC